MGFYYQKLEKRDLLDIKKGERLYKIHILKANRVHPNLYAAMTIVSLSKIQTVRSKCINPEFNKMSPIISGNSKVLVLLDAAVCCLKITMFELIDYGRSKRPKLPSGLQARNQLSIAINATIIMVTCTR